MAPALVAVEIAPPDAAAPLKQSLLDACSRAAEEQCVEAQGEQEPNVVAIVSWADPFHTRLEVALRREQRWVARTMGFGPRDAPEERWRAVGLVIGTLASLMAHSKEPGAVDSAPGPATAAPQGPPSPATPVPLSPPPAEAAPEPAAPNPASVPDHVAEPRPSESSTTVTPFRRGWLEASAVIGSALDRGSPRLGAELDGHLHLGNGIYASLGAAYSTAASRVDGVQTTFAEAFLGLLYARELGASFSGALHAEALGERFSPSIDGGNGGPTSGERWLGGARFGADVCYWAKWTAGVTDVDSAGKFVGSAPAFGYVFRAGATYGFR
jgi:hypothetical protein